MIQVGKLRYAGSTRSIHTMNYIKSKIILDVIDPEDITSDNQLCLYVYVLSPNQIQQAMKELCPLLTIRILHACYENYTLVDTSIYCYKNNTMYASSLEELNNILQSPVAESVKQYHSFLELNHSRSSLEMFCQIYPSRPIWSLFFPSLERMKQLIAELPNNNSFVTNPSLHPLALKILNSVVRSNRDYLCVIDCVDGDRVENSKRVPIFGFIGAHAEVLSDIILNDWQS